MAPRPRTRVRLRSLGLLGALVPVALAQHGVPAESSAAARAVVAARAALTQNTATARNVILFIGDGMGVATVTAARIFDGQSRGETGEENRLAFEELPHVALVKTYNTNQQVPDSAGTSTAVHSCMKTRAGVIGVGPAARQRPCGRIAAGRRYRIRGVGAPGAGAPSATAVSLSAPPRLDGPRGAAPPGARSSA